MTAYLSIVLVALASARRIVMSARSFDNVDRLYALPNGRLVAYGPNGKVGEIRLRNQADAVTVARAAVAPFPQFVCDDSRLTFLGRSKDGNADLYISDKSIAIARYSDEPADYAAMPMWFAITLGGETQEAAIKASHLKQCGAA